MKPIKLIKLFTGLFFLFILATAFSLNNTSNKKKDITGDYLFDIKHKNILAYISVYRENDELFAYAEFADYPVKMQLIDAKKSAYRVKFKNSKSYDLIFKKKKKNDVIRLIFKSCSGDFEISGMKVQPHDEKLRDYHKRLRSKYSYKQPLRISGDWEVSSIYEAGLDTLAVYKVMNNLLKNNDYVHSILIVKDGKLVLEEYLNNWDPLRIHRLQSVTKSFTSALIGLALEKGYIKSIDDPVSKYLPEYESLFDESKKKITIEHLLTMSAGFEWNEDATYYKDPKNCDSHLADASGDYIKYVLSKPLANKPGEAYSYNSAYPNILGYIIEKESGMNISEFAYRYFFTPLGIGRSYWMKITGEDKPSCAGGLWLTSRDMAKFGELYLEGGIRKGKRLLNKDWVRNSVHESIKTQHNTGYGYFWKSTTTLDGKHMIYFASGTGGQYIALIPDFDIVVVTTAKPFTNKADAVAMFLLKEIIPAL